MDVLVREKKDSSLYIEPNRENLQSSVSVNTVNKGCRMLQLCSEQQMKVGLFILLEELFFPNYK